MTTELLTPQGTPLPCNACLLKLSLQWVRCEPLCALPLPRLYLLGDPEYTNANKHTSKSIYPCQITQPGNCGTGGKMAPTFRSLILHTREDHRASFYFSRSSFARFRRVNRGKDRTILHRETKREQKTKQADNGTLRFGAGRSLFRKERKIDR